MSKNTKRSLTVKQTLQVFKWLQGKMPAEGTHIKAFDGMTAQQVRAYISDKVGINVGYTTFNQLIEDLGITWIRGNANAGGVRGVALKGALESQAKKIEKLEYLIDELRHDLAIVDSSLNRAHGYLARMCRDQPEPEEAQVLGGSHD